MKKLLVVSGADRVGKSTFCENSLKFFHKNTPQVVHHSAPSENSGDIFDMYRESLLGKTGNIIFDRSWVCGYILEEFRRHTTNHLLDITQLEIDLYDDGWEIFHLAILRPWSWSAPLHLKELREWHPNVAKWRERDLLVERRAEHLYYQREVVKFFDEVTMFPSQVASSDEAIKVAMRKVYHWFDVLE